MPWITGRKWRPLQGVASPWLGRWEGLLRHGPDITTQPQAPIAGLGWQHRQKHQHPRAGEVSFPTETCKQSRSYSILFLQDSSERNRPGCHSRGSFFFLFLFHGNLSQQHYHLFYKTFQRKQWSPKGKNDPLAGRAGSRIWKTSLHQ